MTSLLQHLTRSLGLSHAQNPEITGICYDSRKLQPGNLYIAIAGARSDGHQFIPAVIAAGAAAIICDQSWFQQHPEQVASAPQMAWLPLANPRAALAEVSAAFYQHPASKLKMLGVTGTNGKTTISQLITRLLEGHGCSTGWIGTLGAGYRDVSLPGQYTTPFPPELHALLAQMLAKGVQALSMECSSHALEQHRLDALAYDVAIFSNLTQDHLDYHLTLEAYAEAKALLFSRLLKPSGTALLNLDDPHYAFFAKAAAEKSQLSYGFVQGADLRASEADYHQEGVSFSLHWQGQQHQAQLALPGSFNVQNALAALGATLVLGYDLGKSLQILAEIQGVPGRMERVSANGHPFAVYVDYSHTPDSLENALQTVRQFTRGRVLVVFGCGGDRDRGKRPLMGQVAQKLADKVFVTSDNPRSEDPEAILQEILSGLQAPQEAVVMADRREAIAAAISQAEPQDVVLIAGKGHETYQLIGDQVLHFDDREVARKFLED